MYRAVVLTTFVVLLLAVAGVSIAGSGGGDPTELTTPERTSLGSTVPDEPETTVPGGPSPELEGVEETTEGTSEPTVITEPTVEETEEPTVVAPVEESPVPHPSATKEHGRPDGVVGLDTGKQGTNGRGVGRPEHAGKPLESGGPEVERGGGAGKQKVTLCHKGKNTITVGAPAVDAHLRHGDTREECVGNAEGAGEPGGESEAEGGRGQEKVALCHKGKPLTVAEPAVDAHLRHGDSLGAC
jgi:hypothetical protein